LTLLHLSVDLKFDVCTGIVEKTL